MYEVFEHTADVGIRARAGSLDELFADAARGLFSVMLANPAAVRPVKTVTFELSGDDVEELLHDWLAELLYTFSARRIALTEFQVRVEPTEDPVGVGWYKRSAVPPPTAKTPAAKTHGGTALHLSHPTRLTATARGEPIDLKRHKIDVEVKAITWHGLKVERQVSHWLVEVIADI